MKACVTKAAIIFFAITLLLAQTGIIYACGMSMIPSSSSSGWTYGNDSAEQSFINYENGVEHLVISRSFENGSADTVWVVPIPADPASVSVDVLSKDPIFSGYDVIASSKGVIQNFHDVLLETQIYPLIPILLLSTFSTAGSMPGDTQMMTNGMSGSFGVRSGVDVYQHLEKNGVTTEVLSATDSGALYGYLKGKGLNTEKDSISILQSYIGKSFSFVAVWVSSSTEQIQAKGVLMNFPTDKMFYPLKPESGTPGEGLPETITVVGHVTPDLYPGIKGSTFVDYYRSSGSTELAGFISKKDDFNYTKITIDTAPRNLSKDLYISSRAPIKAIMATSVSEHPYVYLALLMLVISLASSFIASRLVSADKSFATVLKMALSGCFTLFGTIIGSRVFLREKRWKFVLTHSISFVVLTVALFWIIAAL